MLEDIKGIVLTPQDEADFQAQFPHLVSQPPSIEEPVDYNMIEKNTELIRRVDKLTMDRLNDEPESISIKDAMSIKSEAHKQIQAEKGISDATDTLRLIPSTINIQIINN